MIKYIMTIMLLSGPLSSDIQTVQGNTIIFTEVLNLSLEGHKDAAFTKLGMKLEKLREEGFKVVSMEILSGESSRRVEFVITVQRGI